MAFEIDINNQYDLPVGKKQSTCPLCSHLRKKTKDKCLTINWDRALAKCWHCDETLQVHTYKRKTEKVYSKPEDIGNLELSDKIIKWFESRKISKRTLKKMKISQGIEWMPQTNKDENVIHFNFFINGDLVNIKYRDGAKHFKLYKDAEKVFYNLDGILNNEECIIVEGEIDALSYIEAGINNVVSVPNGANVNLDYLDNCIDYFADKEKIYIAVDNDEKGIILKEELIRRLGVDVCYLVDFDDCKDANEYLIKHSPEKLKATLDRSKECPLEDILTINDVEDDLIDFYENGMPKGFVTGNDHFDEIFSTYLGQFITLTGKPSSGKSDFADEMTVGYNKTYGWKAGFASTENRPVFLHKDKILRKILGKRPNKTIVRTEAFYNVKEYINSNFYEIDLKGGFDLTRVLKKGAELVKRKGIKVLVIDPYNKIPLKESKNQVGSPAYTTEYLNEIDVFCMKYNVLVILVAHPRKRTADQDKNEKIDLYDVKGGGEFYDMSPHGLLVHRNKEEGTVDIKVLKVKFYHLGEDQSERTFVWCPENGRYTKFDSLAGFSHDYSNTLEPLQQKIEYNQDSHIEPNRDQEDDIFSNPNQFIESNNDIYQLDINEATPF